MYLCVSCGFMKYYQISERHFPTNIPTEEFHPDNMGYHIMWLYHHGYRQAAYEEMLVLLENYIKDIVRQCASNYPISLTDYEDLYHEGCEEVMYRMASYDPKRGKPNTYFTKFIQSRCYEVLRKQYEHTSSYYSKIAAKIRKAINECKQNNVAYNENKLAAMTDISVHTIHTTLLKMKYSLEYSLEEIDMSKEVSFKTPESQVLQNEETEIITSALEYLDDIEKEMLILKVFHTGENNRPITYKEISEKTGYSVDVVKKTLNRAKLKLARSREIQESFPNHYYNNRNKIQKKKIIIVPEESADIIEQQLLDSLNKEISEE